MKYSVDSLLHSFSSLTISFMYSSFVMAAVLSPGGRTNVRKLFYYNNLQFCKQISKFGIICFRTSVRIIAAMLSNKTDGIGYILILIGVGLSSASYSTPHRAGLMDLCWIHL